MRASPCPAPLNHGVLPRSLAYSRISLADVAARLHVPTVEDAECIVAKAIRDGAIDALIDHDLKAMVSREVQVRAPCLGRCLQAGPRAMWRGPQAPRKGAAGPLLL